MKQDPAPEAPIAAAGIPATGSKATPSFLRQHRSLLIAALIGMVVPGALVPADAYPTQRFAAELGYINPGVNATTGAVEVKLDVATPPAVLKQDMTVSVDIEVARRAKALIVPIGAVRDADGSAPWVLHVEGRHAVRRNVQLGLRSGGLAEVPRGLAEGDVVGAAPGTLAAGARIRRVAAQRAGGASPLQ